MAEEGAKKKGGKLKFIIIFVVLLAILGGGGFVAWKFFLAQPAGESAASNTTESEPAPPAKEMEPTQMVTLEPFVVNLADPMGRRYLKLNIDVEVVNAGAAADMGASMSKIKDSLLILLSSKTFGEINGLEQKVELKNEIVDRMNQILGPGKIKTVYFTEFVVQ